jgi:zinc transport system permease protein
MIEALQLPFIASYYGVFVVQRGLSFFGSGLAHAAFGGVAIGLWIGPDPLWVALPFTAAVAAGIVWVRERTALGADTAIGIFFAVSMAIGMIALSLREEFTADAFAYLFGSILAISWFDVILAAALVVLAAAAWPAWGRWAYATFDAELARADRLPVLRDDYLLAMLLAVSVVVALKLVGIVLIAAFLVVPAATARLVCRTFFAMTIASAALGALSSLAGLWWAYRLDLPAGPSIVLVQAFFFLIGVLCRTR